MPTEHETGVAYLIRKDGGPTVNVIGIGRFRWAGEYAQPGENGSHAWGPASTAYYFTASERAEIGDVSSLGASWVTVFVNVPADTVGGQ